MRHTAFKCLGAGDVIRALELPGVNAQIAVGRAQECLELIEAEDIVYGERTHDTEAQPFVDEAIERGWNGVDCLTIDRSQRSGNYAASA